MSEMIPPDLIERVAHRFRLLSDETRLRVLAALHEAGEASVGELAELADVPLASASQHLNRLADGGIVARRRRGTRVIYRVCDPAVARICEIVCASVRDEAA